MILPLILATSNISPSLHFPANLELNSCQQWLWLAITEGSKIGCWLHDIFITKSNLEATLPCQQVIFPICFNIVNSEGCEDLPGSCIHQAEASDGRSSGHCLCHAQGLCSQIMAWNSIVHSQRQLPPSCTEDTFHQIVYQQWCIHWLLAELM